MSITVVQEDYETSTKISGIMRDDMHVHNNKRHSENNENNVCFNEPNQGVCPRREEK